LQFATNHLGHFALSLGLHDSLAAPAPPGIVSVSSGGHLRSPVVFDDIDYAFRDTTRSAHTVSRRPPMCCFAVEATRRWAQEGIFVNALMPGGIATPLNATSPRTTPNRRWRRSVQAGPTSSRRAGSGDIGAVGGFPLLDGIGGGYLSTECSARVVNRRREGRWRCGPTDVRRLRALAL